MDYVVHPSDIHNPGDATQLELTAGLLGGAAFTFVLFFGMAYFENFGSHQPPVDIEEIRMVSLPVEPLPPLPTVIQPAEEVDSALPFSGIETGASDSPVSIAVVPPDLEALFPATTTLPKAHIQFNVLQTEFKPKLGFEAEVQHVYQQSEVDQMAHALVRTTPVIPSDVIGNNSTLRVVLLLVINQQGKPESIRIAQSSGSPRFDEIIAHTVQEGWLFSPATRRGKKVRVLAQQPFRVNFNSGYSPFTAEQ